MNKYPSYCGQCAEHSRLQKEGLKPHYYHTGYCDTCGKATTVTSYWTEEQAEKFRKVVEKKMEADQG